MGPNRTTIANRHPARCAALTEAHIQCAFCEHFQTQAILPVVVLHFSRQQFYPFIYLSKTRVTGKQERKG